MLTTSQVNSVPASASAVCVEAVLFNVPRSTFLNAAPPQRLSSYFSPKSQRRARGKYDFVNEHDAVVRVSFGRGCVCVHAIT